MNTGLNPEITPTRAGSMTFHDFVRFWISGRYEKCGRGGGPANIKKKRKPGGFLFFALASVLVSETLAWGVVPYLMV